MNFKKYVHREMQEIMSPDNQWFAGERLGRPETKEELARHYIESGGAENFRKKKERPLVKPQQDEHKSEGTSA